MKKRVGNFWQKVRKHTWRFAVIVIFGIGVYLIGRPVVSLIRTSIDIKELETEKARYVEIIERDSIFLEKLKTKEFLEQYARETFFMQHPNEQVFIVE